MIKNFIKIYPSLEYKNVKIILCIYVLLFFRYMKLCFAIRDLAHKISLLPSNDKIRLEYEKLLLEKCYNMGLINKTGTFSQLTYIQPAQFCRYFFFHFFRRRLPIMMMRLKMAEHSREAIQLVEQGRIILFLNPRCKSRIRNSN